MKLPMRKNSKPRGYFKMAAVLLVLFAGFSLANHNSHESIAERVAPEGNLNIVAGSSANATSAEPKSGVEVYDSICAVCHTSGIAGSPKIGDREQWNTRLAKGMEALIANAINGIQSSSGVMPARGGNPNLSDEEIKAAVEYIIEQSR